jgi:hypothetical protein
MAGRGANVTGQGVIVFSGLFSVFVTFEFGITAVKVHCIDNFVSMEYSIF